MLALWEAEGIGLEELGGQHRLHEILELLAGVGVAGADEPDEAGEGHPGDCLHCRGDGLADAVGAGDEDGAGIREVCLPEGFVGLIVGLLPEAAQGRSPVLPDVAHLLGVRGSQPYFLSSVRDRPQGLPAPLLAPL